MRRVRLTRPTAGVPPPYTIELDCRPLELVATCIEPPTDTATFDVLRSINGGATFESMLYETVTMAAGNRQTQGAQFMWEIPLTRTLADPGTPDAYPMTLRVGRHYPPDGRGWHGHRGADDATAGAAGARACAARAGTRMSVAVRGSSSAMSGTLAVPAGTVAGDLLVAVLVSYAHPSNNETWPDERPFSAPAGWTEIHNGAYGLYVGATEGEAQSSWGYATYARTATGGGTATFTAPEDEQIMGAMVALMSTSGRALAASDAGYYRAFWFDQLLADFQPEAATGSLIVYGFTGFGLGITGYDSFTGVHTHIAATHLHSDTPFADDPFMMGPPYYGERYLDVVLSVDTEAYDAAFTIGERIAYADFDTSAPPDATPPYVTGISGTPMVLITETTPAGGWTAWVVD